MKKMYRLITVPVVALLTAGITTAQISVPTPKPKPRRIDVPGDNKPGTGKPANKDKEAQQYLDFAQQVFNRGDYYQTVAFCDQATAITGKTYPLATHCRNILYLYNNYRNNWQTIFDIYEHQYNHNKGTYKTYNSQYLLFYDGDSPTIDYSMQETFDRLAAEMRSNSGTYTIVACHTDATGTSATNSWAKKQMISLVCAELRTRAIDLSRCNYTLYDGVWLGHGTGATFLDNVVVIYRE